MLQSSSPDAQTRWETLGMVAMLGIAISCGNGPDNSGLSDATMAQDAGLDATSDAPPDAGVHIKMWGGAELIESDDTDRADEPEVAFDAAGNALAVWDQSDGTRRNVWANRYVLGTGWGTPELIETTDNGGARDVQLAVDAAGNALAVWIQFDDTRSDIWANRYVLGTGWGTAELIETDDTSNGGAREVQVTMDTAGNAIAVWYQHTDYEIDIWTNRYVLGTGWGSPELLEDNDGSVREPQVAIAPNGDAVAVWTQYDTSPSINNVWANHYVSGTGWGTAVPLETNDGSGHNPQVAIDSVGNATVVWNQLEETRRSIWANQYDTLNGWGTAVLVENDDAGDAADPQVAYDGAGNAHAVWWQSDGSTYDINTSRFVSGTGWGTPQLLETDTGDAFEPQITFGPSGNEAIAIWYQSDGTADGIRVNHYTAAGGWGTALDLETGDGAAYSAHVALDASGNAIAVWKQKDETRFNIWANRFQ